MIPLEVAAFLFLSPLPFPSFKILVDEVRVAGLGLVEEELIVTELVIGLVEVHLVPKTFLLPSLFSIAAFLTPLPFPSFKILVDEVQVAGLVLIEVELIVAELVIGLVEVHLVPKTFLLPSLFSIS